MSETDDPIRRDPEARQFSVRRLLVLAVLCAVIGGTGQVVGLSPNHQIIFTFLLMGVAFYLVFRLPYGVLSLLRRTNRWKRLKAQRAELEEMANRKRREFHESRGDDADEKDPNADA
jgi:uncharacterized membrane protein YfcA